MKLLKYIKNSYLVGIIIWMIIGCSIGIRKSHDSYFNEYLDKFIAESKVSWIKHSGISIRFKQLAIQDEYKTIGRCYYFLRHIDIDPNFWYNSICIQKEALIMHELGHCVCFQDHKDKKRKDGCPVSLMNSVIPNIFCLIKYWEEYKKELYEGC